MQSIISIFIKQVQDILKNKGVLLQAVTFPALAFVLTNFVDLPHDIPDSMFISLFAIMFVGLVMISNSATIIAEDRERKSLRFLMMAGVKSHQYLMGIGGVLLVFALAVSSLFAMMMPGFSLMERLIFLGSLMLGAVASILLGAIVGMFAKNEQSSISISMTVGMLMGFGPMVAAFNETTGRMFSIFYTMNFIYYFGEYSNMTRSLSVMIINVAILAVMFAWVYGKRGLRA